MTFSKKEMRLVAIGLIVLAGCTQSGETGGSTKPDLTIESVKFVQLGRYDTNDLNAGKNYAAIVKVWNFGTAKANGFVVGTIAPQLSGCAIPKAVYISGLDINRSADANLTGTCYSGTKTIVFKADVNNSVIELYENNNAKTRTVKVK